MMTRLGILFSMIFLLTALGVRNVDAQVGPVVISPRPGQVLQGVVTIQGSSDVAGFVSADVAFTYSTDTTGTWFLIAKSSKSVSLDTLASWDTTTITDGEYTLRMRVHLKGGGSMDVLVTNLRVRNYTPVETPTPEPTAILPTATPIPTLTYTPFPLPTPLPTNPAILTPVDVSNSIAFGGFGAVLFLIVIGVYFALRRR